MKIFLYTLILMHPLFIYSNTNYIFMGPPGSGKGTFSTYMKNTKGYEQISIGDIIRYHKKNDTEIGRQIKANNGFVTDEIAFAIIEDAIIKKIKNKQPFILDGFPRNKTAFDFLLNVLQRENLLSDVTFVHFNIDDTTCLHRINNRLVCSSCAMSFTSSSNVSECSKCKKPLENRPGDDQTTTIKRLEIYHQETEPLIPHIAKNFKVIEIHKDSSYQDLFK